jgi:hypothetical protein
MLLADHPFKHAQPVGPFIAKAGQPVETGYERATCCVQHDQQIGMSPTSNIARYRVAKYRNSSSKSKELALTDADNWLSGVSLRPFLDVGLWIYGAAKDRVRRRLQGKSCRPPPIRRSILSHVTFRENC